MINSRLSANSFDSSDESSEALDVSMSDDEKRMKFMIRPITTWSREDFVTWILDLMIRDQRIIENEFFLEAFAELSPASYNHLLQNLNVQTFLELDPKFGHIVFENLPLNTECDAIIAGTEVSKFLLSDFLENPVQMRRCSSESSESSASDNLPFIPGRESRMNNGVIDPMHGISRIKKPKLPGKDKKRKDCLHVWEFLRDILRDPSNQPGLVEWLNKDKFTFKINKKDEVARMWGERKNRRTGKSMTYEKMSRGIRYSRDESGCFDAPDKIHGTRFVFKFGLQAIQNCPWLQSLMKP